jgi:hypothetical protein
LKDDLSEKNNLADTHPEKARELHDKLAAWRESVGAKMPGPNDDQSASERPKGKGKGKKKAKRRQARQAA